MEITCMYKLFAKRILVYVLSVSMLCVGMPSSAGVIGTQTLLDAEQSTGSLERVEAFLARDRVRDQMVAFGPSDRQRRGPGYERIASCTILFHGSDHSWPQKHRRVRITAPTGF
jgi:hypothetical protein